MAHMHVCIVTSVIALTFNNSMQLSQRSPTESMHFSYVGCVRGMFLNTNPGYIYHIFCFLFKEHQNMCLNSSLGHFELCEK